jgi:hypothetical protein
LIYDRRMWLWDYRLRSRLMVAEGVNLFEAKKRVRLKAKKMVPGIGCLIICFSRGLC